MKHEPKQIIMREKLERLASRLEANNFGVTVMETAEEAAEFIKNQIPSGASVGVGGSVTLDELGLIDWLRDNPEVKFIDRYRTDDRKKAFHDALLADVFLMSTNAVTMEGFLYNIDGTGNRLAALIYGPDKVYVIAGANKIVKDLDEAKTRVEQIAAPANCVRLNKDNPCVKMGECMHCNHESTICNQYVVTRRSGEKGRIHIILVNEELGY